MEGTRDGIPVSPGPDGVFDGTDDARPVGIKEGNPDGPSETDGARVASSKTKSVTAPVPFRKTCILVTSITLIMKFWKEFRPSRGTFKGTRVPSALYT